MNKFGIGIIKIPFRKLEKFLQLPNKHKILDIECNLDDRFNKTLSIVVRGPGLPEHTEGQSLMVVFLDELIGEKK